MSWFSSHYDKALLGAAGLITLALLYFGWSQIQSADEDFSAQLKGKGKESIAVQGAERVDFALQSMDLDHGWRQGNDDGRMVNLFTGIPLFIQRDTGRAIDLLDGPQVHPPIDNDFWIEYGVDPGFADSPSRDPDSDGFSNLEEFLAKTSPVDSEDHPPLIHKLRFVREEKLSWRLKPSYLGQEGAVPITYFDSQGGRNRASAADPVEPGQLFFDAGAAQGRFKYLGHKDIEEENPAVGIVAEVTLVQIEDQKANKAGKVYEIPAPLKRADFDEHTYHDRSAVLVLEAIGAEGQEMLIEENTRFSLPALGGKNEYHLLSVGPQSIVVEYPKEDGERATVEIQRGAMPQLN
ncbi:MAG: Amuc_1099 family pilus-like system protein [Akkermansiaceae bacterium]|nr:Amuc_1099 family pilus-like system protein [Akkermansiaceae bacterium]